MAELTADQLSAFFQNLDPATIVNFFKTFSDQANAALNQITSFGDGVTKLSDQTDKAGVSLQHTGTRFTELPTKKAAEGVDSFSYSAGNATKSILQLGGQLGLLTVAMGKLPPPTMFEDLGKNAMEASTGLADVTKNMMNLLGIKQDNSLAGQIFSYLQNLGQLSDVVKKNELNLIAMTARSGELGDLLENIGDDLGGLSLKMEKFSDLTAQIGDASGFSSHQVASFANELMRIPGAMDTTVKLWDQGTESIHLLDATMKVAAGTGQGFNQVVDQMSVMFENFGEVGKDPLEVIAKISSASQELKVPLDLVRSYTLDAGNAFKMFGDNTQGALKILDRFAPALKEQGLGAKPMIDIISQVTHGIEGMGLAQKAFLSAQTGGARGLQGAFQIDLLLKQGKIDEVYKKVEENLRKQFGGRIITLEEAAKSPGAAAEFTKQVKMLQSPAMGGIAKTESEAYRILDVLAKGKTVAEGKTPEKAFQDALKVGDSIQQRQYDVLVQINNKMERLSTMQALSAYDVTRNLLGTTRAGLGETIAQTRQTATLSAAQEKLITGTGIEQGRKVGEVIDDFANDFGGSVDDLTRQTGSVFNNLLGNLKDIGGSVFGEGGGKFALAPPASAYERVAKGGAREGIRPATNITVQSLCPSCARKIAHEEASDVVNQAMQQEQSGNYMHNHIGIKP